MKLSLLYAAIVASGCFLTATTVSATEILSGVNLSEIVVQEGTSMSVSVSPDGKWLAVDLQGSLWIIPSKGGKAKRISDVYGDARQPVWSPDGKSLAFFAFIDGGYDLWLVDPEGNNRKQLTWGPYDDRDPIWSPDGKKIAFASDRGAPGSSSYNIWVLDVATGNLTQVTDNVFENRMPSWSPDSKEIVYSSVRDNASGLWATAIATGTERELLLSSTGTVGAPSWGPAGQLSYVIQDGGNSQLIVDGKAVSGTENAFSFRLSWLKDGRYYYVSDGKIRERNTRRSNAFRTVEFTAALQTGKPDYVRVKRDFDSLAPRKALGIVRPALSPDGTQVAFVAVGDLYLLKIGEKPQNLTNDHYMEADPAWSPDGKYLVYSSDKGGKLMQLWIREIATGKERQLTDIANQPLGAAWSPDGTKIAFLDTDGMWGVAGLCVIDVKSSEITRLQPTLGQPGKPSWSADSQYVAISLSFSFSRSFREGTNQVYVVPADGKGKPVWYSPVKNLSIDTRGGGGPVWSPDGTKMAAIYGGELHVWPVSVTGEPLGPPRSLSSDIAHSPSWSGDSASLLFQSDDKLKKVDIHSGTVTEVPLKLEYTLAIPAGRKIIHVGQLFDGVENSLKQNVDIIIEGNRITDVLPHDPARHAGAEVIDASRLTAIPGLIEGHAHPQKDFGTAAYHGWLAYGITTVRDPGNQPYHGVSDREASEAGVLIGPRLYTTGHLMEWQRVYYKMGIAIAGPAHLEKELARAKALKFDLVKSYVRLPDPQQKRVVEFAHHEMGIPVASHEVFPASLVGVDNIEHLGATSRRGYSPKQAAGHSYEDMIQLANKTITPTVFGALAYYIEKHPHLKDDPRLTLYPQWAQNSVRNPRSMPESFMENTAQTLKKIYDAGANVTAGTDTMIAINYHAELAFYVNQAGLTPYQALRSATAVPAAVLGLDAGTLEAGKLADIVLIEGDPLQDISNTVNVRKVVSNGRVFDVADLINNKVAD